MMEDIGFTPEMIEAIRGGRKTQTRRLPKGQPWGHRIPVETLTPPCQVGDVLPVRGCAGLCLVVTAMYLEPLQRITQADAMAEGFAGQTGNFFADMHNEANARSWFQALWDSIYDERGFGWKDEPVVWVIEFRIPRLDLADRTSEGDKDTKGGEA